MPTKSSFWLRANKRRPSRGEFGCSPTRLRRALLPPLLSPPDGLEAADYYFTASDDDVGGDFYDLFPLTRTTWGFFLGDARQGSETGSPT